MSYIVVCQEGDDTVLLSSRSIDDYDDACTLANGWADKVSSTTGNRLSPTVFALHPWGAVVAHDDPPIGTIKKFGDALERRGFMPRAYDKPALRALYHAAKTMHGHLAKLDIALLNVGVFDLADSYAECNRGLRHFRPNSTDDGYEGEMPDDCRTAMEIARQQMLTLLHETPGFPDAARHDTAVALHGIAVALDGED